MLPLTLRFSLSFSLAIRNFVALASSHLLFLGLELNLILNHKLLKSGTAEYDYEYVIWNSFTYSLSLNLVQFAKLSEKDIVEMIFFPVVNEACRVFAEGIAVKAADLDIASVMGMGFPVYRFVTFIHRGLFQSSSCFKNLLCYFNQGRNHVLGRLSWIEVHLLTIGGMVKLVRRIF